MIIFHSAKSMLWRFQEFIPGIVTFRAFEAGKPRGAPGGFEDVSLDAIRPGADDALSNAIEVIECHIGGLLADGEPVPAARPLECHQRKRDHAGGIRAWVDVDLSKLSGQVKRINIIIPERILSQIDSYASSHGETRSGLLAHAALEDVSSQAKHEAHNKGCREAGNG